MRCMDAKHTKHVTYKLASHFVWFPKYRKKILVGKLATFLEQEIRRICSENTWNIGAVSIQADHVHLFLSAPPSVSPSQIAHTLMGTIARKVFQCSLKSRNNFGAVLSGLVRKLTFQKQSAFVWADHPPRFA